MDQLGPPDEAANYNAFGSVFHEVDQQTCSYRNLPAWCLFNQAFYDKWGFLDAQLIGTGDGHKREPADWIHRGDTLAALAAVLDVPGDALEATVARFNMMVDQGHDDDFGRGDSYYDLYWGDPDHKGEKLTVVVFLSFDFETIVSGHRSRSSSLGGATLRGADFGTHMTRLVRDALAQPRTVHCCWSNH